MSIPKNPAAATVEQQESAAMAALDLASPSEAASVPKRLVADMREAAWLLAESLTPVAPAPAVKSRLLSRVAQFEQLKPLADVRRNEEHWVNAGMPGVDIKPLFQEKRIRPVHLPASHAARCLAPRALSPRYGTMPGAKGRYRLGRSGLRRRRFHRDGQGHEAPRDPYDQRKPVAPHIGTHRFRPRLTDFSAPERCCRSPAGSKTRSP